MKQAITRFMSVEKGSFGDDPTTDLGNMVELFEEASRNSAGWQVLHATIDQADAASISVVDKFFLTQPPYSHIKITFERMDD